MHSELNDFWENLQQTGSDFLTKEIPVKSEVAYFDYPVHSNIGDLLILMGTENWMEQTNLSVLHRLTLRDGIFPKLKPEVIILCQGGGNFGDLYKHQKYRERIVKKYPNNKIVFLPQTIFYKKHENILNTAAVLNKHSNLVIYLRDDRSMQIAGNNFNNAKLFLCPDMATFLYPLNFIPSKNDRDEEFFLLRRDKEKTINHFVVPKAAWEGDWTDITKSMNLVVKIIQLSILFFGRVLGEKLIYKIWKPFARSLVKKSIDHFYLFKKVTTSRLHGHILALLLGIPVILIDNNYGKNGHYYKKWHKKFNLVEFKSKQVFRSIY